MSWNINHKRVLLVSLGLILGVLLLSSLRSARNESHLLLAHSMTTDHPVHIGIVEFAKEVEKRSEGRIKITIYPNGQLGSEKEILSLVQIGAITMTKVSTLSLESFSPLLGILNLPFLFENQRHYQKVLDSSVGEELLSAAVDQRLMGLTYYEAGDRSFYAHKPIQGPEDMRGMKMRVMDNPTAIRMLTLLGGSPTPMPYGEVYTALQQGVIDGAENNITALTVNRHGEVSKFFSLDQHIFAPDTLIISEPVWRKMPDEDKKILKEAAEASKVFQRKLWNEKTAEYEKEAKEKLGVQFIYPDKAPFKEKVQILHTEFKKRGENYSRLIDAIKAAAAENQ